MGQKTNTSSDDTLSESPAFPLVVFSHGLGGTRTTYSQYCGELASRGNIVLAPEHRDGSGPITVVRSATGEERSVLYLKPEDLTSVSSLRFVLLVFALLTDAPTIDTTHRILNSPRWISERSNSCNDKEKSSRS